VQRHAIPAAFMMWAMILPASADTGEEIDHLLAFVDSSGCTYVRNGKEYSPAEAREHIGRKYDYIRDRISTTEQFIRYAATESSISGKPYTVICGGQEEPSADWLKRELARYRAAPPGPGR
jgi:hypothetical protein